MIIETKYNFGDITYLKTDKEQSERIITGFLATPLGLTIKLACGTQETWHYEMEITEEKNVLATTTN